MGNISSRLCSAGELDDPVASAPRPSAQSEFQQRPFELSTEPPRLHNIPSTSSFGISTSDHGTTRSRTLRTRASLPTLTRSSSHQQRSRLLALARSPSMSEKRLSPNSEQLLAIEFGIAPGQTKVVSLRTPKVAGSPTCSSGSVPSQSDHQGGQWVLGGQIPSRHLHLGASEGSVTKKASGRRWSLRSLSNADGATRAESFPMLDHVSARPTIPPRVASLPAEGTVAVEPETKDASPPISPERQILDSVLLRHQLRHTLNLWANGAQDIEAIDVQERWQSLLSILQQALAGSPQSVKHLVRVSDAIDRSLSLLPGNLEHASLIAEVSDGLREVLDILIDTLDAAMMGRPASHQTFGKRFSETLRRVRRGSAASTRSLAVAPTESRAEPEQRRVVHGLAFDESIFSRPRPAFMGDEPLATPDLTSASPTASDHPSPAGPFTPPDLHSPHAFVRSNSLALPIGFIAYNDAPKLSTSTSSHRPTHARSSSLSAPVRAAHKTLAKARPSTSTASSAAATFGSAVAIEEASPSLSYNGTFGQGKSRESVEIAEKRWTGGSKAGESPSVAADGAMVVVSE